MEKKMVQEKSGWHAVYEEIKKTVAVVQVMKTVFVPNEKGKIIASEYVISQGSGFVYRGKKGTLGLITAYHVVGSAKQERIVAWTLTRQGKWTKIDNCKISQFSNQQEDVAVLTFDPSGESAEDFETVGFPAEAFKGKILRVGYEVVWCGYPAAVNPFVPILQKGMIAGYDGTRCIVDGMPNPGNSGGPVFYNYSKQIVGMIVAYAPQPSRYKLPLVEGEENKVVQIFANPSGLGVVIPATRILKLFGLT